MLWFFVLILVSFDGHESRSTQGPFVTEAACRAGIVDAGRSLPQWAEHAYVQACERQLFALEVPLFPPDRGDGPDVSRVCHRYRKVRCDYPEGDS